MSCGEVCLKGVSETWWSHRWLTIRLQPFATAHLVLANEIGSYLSVTNRYEELEEFVEDVLEMFPQNRNDFLKEEPFLLSVIDVFTWKKRFGEVYKLISDGKFSNNDQAVLLWDQTHYKEIEHKTGKPLTPVNRFRIRVKHPPPSNICQQGCRPTISLPKESVRFLRQWWHRHQTWPFPNKQEVGVLSQRSGLSVLQVRTWFANARRRNNLFRRNFSAHRGNKPQHLRLANKSVKNKKCNETKKVKRSSSKAEKNSFTPLQELRRTNDGPKPAVRASLSTSAQQPEVELKPFASVASDPPSQLVLMCAPIFFGRCGDVTGNDGNPHVTTVTLSTITCNIPINWSLVETIKLRMNSVITGQLSTVVNGSQSNRTQESDDDCNLSPKQEKIENCNDNQEIFDCLVNEIKLSAEQSSTENEARRLAVEVLLDLSQS